MENSTSSSDYDHDSNSTEEPEPVVDSGFDYVWHVGNSRECPQKPLINSILDPLKIDGKTTASKRSNDQWAKYIAQQRRGGRHAPVVITTRPPPKLTNSGQWEYIEYIPEWTDPLWHDSELQLESVGKTGYNVRPYSILRYLRPAHLPQDRPQNPTTMATRYGIFPGRQDGRSRMTPTRQAFRKFPFNGTKRKEINGPFMWEQAEILAQKQGLGVDDLIKTYSAMTKDERRMLNVGEEFVMRSMEEIQDDEDWQRAFLQGFSTNELIEEGIMSFDNTFQTDLGQQIHPFLERDKWGDTLDRGGHKDTPRLIYQTASRKGEWNPGTDDFLWERLQPALVLASRIIDFLGRHDPFWFRLLDIFNRVPIEPERDDRPEDQRKKIPSHSFSMQGPAGPTAASENGPLAMDPVQQTLGILNKIEFSISSGFHHEGAADRTPTAGNTVILGGDLISVGICGDSIWPLLVEGYSRDEHMMCAFMVAGTIIHELAHAVNYAHYILLVQPGPDEIEQLVDEVDLQEALKTIGKSIYGEDPELYLEPFFEREQEAELGFCMESHLFGGVCWPLLAMGPLSAKHLYFLPSGIVLRRWPFPLQETLRPMAAQLAKTPSDLVLAKPYLAARAYLTPVHIAQIRRFFTEAFWQTEVPRFGPAALRMLSDAPRRIMPQMHEEFPSGSLDMAENTHNELVFEAYPKDIRSKNPIVWHFVEMVTHELLRFNSAVFTWHRDWRASSPRLVAVRQKLGQMSIQTEELALASFHPKNKDAMGAFDMYEWEERTMVEYGEFIDQIRQLLTAAHFVLPEGSGEILDSRHDHYRFWDLLRTRASDALPRINALLRVVHEDLLYEVETLQSLYLDIYKLDDKQRAKFEKQPVVKHLQDRLRNLMDTIIDARLVVGRLRDADFPADLTAQFEAKYQALWETASQLRGWAHDVKRIGPDNWKRLLPLIPNIDTTKRPGSVRIAKIAQKEISLMPAAMLAPIAKYLRGLKGVSPEAALVDVDVRKDVTEMMDALANNSSLQAKVDEDERERRNPAFEKRKREEEDDDDDDSGGGGVVRKRYKFDTYRPVIIPDRLKRASSLKRLAPAMSDPLWEAKFAHTTTMQDAARAFGSMPPVSFGQALPPPAPGPTPMVGVVRDPAAPPDLQPMEIFPSAYALTATFTEDLAEEAALVAAAMAAPEQIEFERQRAQLGFGMAYREPPGGELSPISERSPQRTLTHESGSQKSSAGSVAGGASTAPAGAPVRLPSPGHVAESPVGAPLADAELELSFGDGDSPERAAEIQRRRMRRRRAGFGGGGMGGDAMDWQADGQDGAEMMNLG